MLLNVLLPGLAGVEVLPLEVVPYRPGAEQQRVVTDLTAKKKKKLYKRKNITLITTTSLSLFLKFGTIRNFGIAILKLFI